MDADTLSALSPCDYADALPRSQFMSHVIRPLWSPMPRVAGPAFTVKCGVGDHLMLHAAIYEAKPGDIIVVEADENYAVAGGNVCAIAQKRGIVAFVVDGTIRDLAEVREHKFPVFAKGVIPKPGAKKVYLPLNMTVQCGGATVNQGDWIVADEEGIVVIPKNDVTSAVKKASERAESDASVSLQDWQAKHQSKVEQILATLKPSS